MAVDDDFVGIGLAYNPDEFAREKLEPGVDFRPDAMNEIAREVPVIEGITDVHHPPECPSQYRKHRERKRRRQHERVRQADVNHRKARRRDRQPDHAANEGDRIEKEAAVTPSDDEVFDDRAGENELHHRGHAERKTPPIAFGHVGGDDVVPAEIVEVGFNAPVRPRGVHRPIRNETVREKSDRRDVALQAPSFKEPSHLPDISAMAVFGANRLVAGQLHETTLVHERLRHGPPFWRVH